MAAPVLFSFRRCPFAIRARLAIHASGKRCELREVVLRDKPAAMLRASPKATVPVLVKVDGTVLDESVDIMLWALGQRDPGNWLTPQRGTREQMLALVADTDSHFKFHLDRYKYASRYPGEDPLHHREQGAQFLRGLDERLAADGYLFGAVPCLADVAIAPFVRQFALADRAWFEAAPFAALRTWLAEFESSGRFAAVMKKYPQWQEGDAPVIFPPREDGALAGHG